MSKEYLETHILPLINKVSWDGFDKDNPIKCLSLQFKLTKHYKEKNIDKLKSYIAFSIKQWPKLDDCPIDRNLLQNIMEFLRANQ